MRVRKAYIWLLPSLFLLGFLSFFSFFHGVWQSLHLDGSWSEGSLSAYRTVLTDERVRESLGFSLYIAFLSTLISLIVGWLLTRWLYYSCLHRYAKALAWLPMLVPHFVAAYVIILFFSQSGWVPSLFFHAGVIEDPADFPALTQDRSGVGILLTYMWKEVPFVILMLLPAYVEMDERLRMVVYTLGGGKAAAFKEVEWPQIKPIFFETAVILFAFTFAAFEVPQLIGASDPQMLAVLTYEWFHQGLWERRPEALAIMMMTTLVFLLLAWGTLRWVRGLRYRMMKGGAK
ncbi:hypothetical protein [Salsuginibacillus kocurii]|uniref:hypothetical protein n=1 Tax=Salsuginibacillus kocurii TaxID=427078 RepID=UPI0003773BDE|nr:hypothetical protein [Salsuginibacillus kocurii]